MQFFGAIFGESVDYVTGNTCNISGINTYHLVQFIKRHMVVNNFFIPCVMM